MPPHAPGTPSIAAAGAVLRAACRRAVRRAGVPLRLLRFVLGHPLAGRRRWAALGRLLRWQVGGRLGGLPAVMDFVPPTRLLVRRGSSSATANLYAGLADFAEMGFVMHALRPGDLFGDVGANVGAYSVLAAGVAGASVLAVEPAPGTLPELRDNLRLNDLCDRVEVLAAALGERPGTLRLSARRGAASRVLAENEDGDAATVPVAVSVVAVSVVVPVTTLDAAFAGRAPLVLKLDVEGYEARVLAGGAATLSAPGPRAVLAETLSHGARYGDGGIDAALRGHGFAPFDYDPARRALTPRDGPGRPNTLYLRDPGFFAARLAAAPAFSVLGEGF